MTASSGADYAPAICPDCREHDDGSRTCNPAMTLCPLYAASGADQPTIRDQLRPLACPYCGGKLTVDTETKGPAYLTYEVPESITCDGMGCQAVWEPDGTPRELPAFVRFPSLYTQPEPSR